MPNATGKPLVISSLANPEIKKVVKLRQRSHRDELELMIVEGCREIKRALDSKHFPCELYFCRDLFQGGNEDTLIETCAEAGARLFECAIPVFEKIAYGGAREGLLAVAPQVRNVLSDLRIPDNSLVIVAEAIEKPGNLGTILRSADAAGVAAVLVCDRCTDINNPNVVRASIGTLFALPVVETSTAEALAWLKRHNFKVVAATPHSDTKYWDVNFTGNTAVVVGTEQHGLSSTWLDSASLKVKIPMLGQADSLNVASATTILLYEAVRQRFS